MTRDNSFEAQSRQFPDGIMSPNEIRGVYDRHPWLYDAYPPDGSLARGPWADEPTESRMWSTVRLFAVIFCVLVWLVATILFITSPAPAAGAPLPDTPVVWQTSALLRYDPPPAYAARTYTGPPMTVRRAPAARLPALCGLEPGGLVGCAIVRANSCDVIVASHLPRALLLEVLNHERAHCMGYHHQE